MNSTPFGTMPDGREVREYTLDNGRGLSLRAINLGGIVTALNVPDRAGACANVVLGFDNLADYLERNGPYFGALVGRYANRIAHGRFTLDGEPYLLQLNDGPNALHGGPRGFSRRWWAIEQGSAASLVLTLRSADGDEHYPGNLDVTVRYTLTAENEFRIDYQAKTDAPTLVNLTHHGYFNLAGGGTALDHRLTLNAAEFLAVDERLIPCATMPVEGTPFDFRQPQRIAARIGAGDAQLLRGHGYDHNFIVQRSGAGSGLDLVHAATLADPASGRVMEVHTSEPGIQFYSGNFLDGSLRGSQGHAYRQGDGVCLETQHYPDSPNHPEYPSTVLRPGETYQSTTVHRFRNTEQA